MPALYSRITFSALHGRAAARTGFPQLQTDKISNTGKVRKGDMMYRSVVFLYSYLCRDHCSEAGRDLSVCGISREGEAAEAEGPKALFLYSEETRGEHYA